MTNIPIRFVIISSITRLAFCKRVYRLNLFGFTKRVYRILNIFEYPIMVGKGVKLENMLMRLEEADKKAKDLSNEIQCIRSDIAVLQKQISEEKCLPIRKTPRKTILLDSVPSCSNIDETPAKRLKTTELCSNTFDSDGFMIVEDHVMVYTSGVCHNAESDKAKAGIGVWFTKNNPKNISKPVIGEATKDKADIQACLHALGFLNDCEVRKVKLHTSSKLIIKCMTLGTESLKAKNSGEIENKEDLIQLNKFARDFDDVQWVYFEDDHANILAEKGASMFKNYKKPKDVSSTVKSNRKKKSDKTDSDYEILHDTDDDSVVFTDSTSLKNDLFSDYLNKKGAPSVVESNKKKKQPDETDSGVAAFQKSGDYVIVYTDGACSNNGKPGAKAGIGVWFGDNHNMNISKPVEGRATNNTAEIQACLAALEALKGCGVKKVELHTDSQFTLNSITLWIHRWKKGGWKTSTGKPVKNKEDFVKLYDCVSQFDDIRWVLEQGHAGVRGNEEADKLAKLGATRYKPMPN